MPNPLSTVFMASFHPAEGTLPEEVSQIEEWAQKQKGIKRWMLVTEPNENGDGRHSHLAFETVKPSRNQDQQDKFKTLFKDKFGNPRWNEHVSIKVTSPPDFAQICYGYLAKDGDHEVINSHGEFPIEEIEKAEKQYAENLRIGAIKRTSRSGLTNVFVEHHKLYNENPNLLIHCDYDKMKTYTYRDSHSRAQIEYISRQLVIEGYVHLILDLNNPKFISALVNFWTELTESKNKVTLEINSFKEV